MHLKTLGEQYRTFQILLEDFSLLNSVFGKETPPSCKIWELSVHSKNFVTPLSPALSVLGSALFGTFRWGEQVLTIPPGVRSEVGWISCLCLAGCESSMDVVGMGKALPWSSPCSPGLVDSPSLGVGSLSGPGGPGLPYSLWGMCDTLGCWNQKVRWVLRSLSLKVLWVCAQAGEIKEFKCLLCGIAVVCCGMYIRNQWRTAPSPAVNLGSYWS